MLEEESELSAKDDFALALSTTLVPWLERERIADPRWLGVDIVPEHANRCTTQSARLPRASSQ
jgi:hypothetical protein